MITTGIDPIRQNEDIHRADFIATKTTTLANFLQNPNLRHKILLSDRYFDPSTWYMM